MIWLIYLRGFFLGTAVTCFYWWMRFRNLAKKLEKLEKLEEQI